MTRLVVHVPQNFPCDWPEVASDQPTSHVIIRAPWTSVNGPECTSTRTINITRPAPDSHETKFWQEIFVLLCDCNCYIFEKLIISVCDCKSRLSYEVSATLNLCMRQCSGVGMSHHFLYTMKRFTISWSTPAPSVRHDTWESTQTSVDENSRSEFAAEQQRVWPFFSLGVTCCLSNRMLAMLCELFWCGTLWKSQVFPRLLLGAVLLPVLCMHLHAPLLGMHNFQQRWVWYQSRPPLATHMCMCE